MGLNFGFDGHLERAVRVSAAGGYSITRPPPPRSKCETVPHIHHLVKAGGRGGGGKARLHHASTVRHCSTSKVGVQGGGSAPVSARKHHAVVGFRCEGR